MGNDNADTHRGTLLVPLLSTTAKQPRGGSRGCWAQPRDAGRGRRRGSCWMRRRGVLAGTRGRAHTTLPCHLRKSTPSLRKDFFLIGLCFPPQGVLQSCRGSGRVQGPRERNVSDLRAEQGLRGRDNTTTTLLEAGHDFDVLNVSMIPRTAAATTRRRRAGTVAASRHTQV